ncbi:MAG: hypothetical protein LC100_15025 [Chitinophagales bacterium]|nr:hypothetical protein [Chitinophagales bacterium]
MAKYTFIRESDDGEINTAFFEADTWFVVLDRFVPFLRGGGYSLQSDSIGINTKHHLFYPYGCETANIVAFEKE